MAPSHENVIEDLRSSIQELELHTIEEGASLGASSSSRKRSRISKGEKTDKKERDLNSSSEAFQRILRSLNVADQAESSLIKKLQKDGYSETAIEEAIAHAKDLGFIDDERYARLYFRSMMSKGKGIDGTIRDLKRMGITVEEYDSWPDEFFEEELPDEASRAWALLEKKPPRGKNLRESAYRKLVSKGFNQGTASAIARKWMESQV